MDSSARLRSPQGNLIALSGPLRVQRRTFPQSRTGTPARRPARRPRASATSAIADPPRATRARAGQHKAVCEKGSSQNTGVPQGFEPGPLPWYRNRHLVGPVPKAPGPAHTLHTTGTAVTPALAAPPYHPPRTGCHLQAPNNSPAPLPRRGPAGARAGVAARTSRMPASSTCPDADLSGNMHVSAALPHASARHLHIRRHGHDRWYASHLVDGCYWLGNACTSEDKHRVASVAEALVPIA